MKALNYLILTNKKHFSLKRDNKSFFEKILKVIFTMLGMELRAEIHQALLSHFYLIAEFLIGKLLVKEGDSRVVKLVNLNPVINST